jgi:hypothetical protein
LTTEPFTKFVPFTVSTKPVRLHAEGDEVVADEIAGGNIANGLPPEVPPPGTRSVTSMFAVPADPRSVAGTVTVSEAVPVVGAT